MNNKENNKLIAEFMGITDLNTKSYSVFEEPNLKYFRVTEYKRDGLCPYCHNHAEHGHNLQCYILDDDKLKYLFSWNWLMPVVGKIRTIPSYDGDKFGTDVTITGDKTTIKSGCYGTRKHGDYFFNKTFTGEFNTTEATYKSVVEFINHYNRKTIK